ncbi:MAG: ClC family H(+)/Cl(-) exchange transporter [Anaerocolumna sp.]
MKMKNNYKSVINTDSTRLHIVYKSMLVGLLAGVVTCAYRLLLEKAEVLSFMIYDFFRNHLILLPILFLVLGTGGYCTGLLINKFKMISGSGIPQVKGIIMGYFKNKWIGTLIAKSVGGLLSILAGLSLGREGPSIQIGACVAEGVGKKLAVTRHERKVLIASGASAGLAAAFNAPLAGAMFAMEEIFKYFSPVILLSTMVSAVIADYISKIVFGLQPIFQFNLENSISLKGYWLLILLGAVLGVCGAFYNYILILTQKLYKKVKWLNKKNRPIIPFALAGILGLVFPIVLGGGHVIMGEIKLSSSLTFLFIILIVKFIFSMISFGSGAPGGIFFPLLVMGAAIGAVFGNIAINYLGFDADLFYNFVILAMVGFFTSIVRAPITGVILLIEMTGSFTHLLPLTITSIFSYVVADLLKSAPIYDSLLENQVAEKGTPSEQPDSGKKVTFEIVVHHGSSAENKYIKDIKLPDNCLFIAIKRNQLEFIPNGNTKILAGDYLILLTDVNAEALIREKLNYIATIA